MGVKISAVLLLAVLAVGIPAGAGATGVKVTVNNGSDAPQGQLQSAMTRGDLFRDPRPQYPDPRLQYPDPRTHYADPRQQYADPRLQYPDPRQPSADPRRHPGTEPRPVAPAVVIITQPVYLAAQPGCVVPGYWAYTWMPQSYVSTVWVPGYYNADALWVEGHYEPRADTWGYYQPYWVPEHAC